MVPDIDECAVDNGGCEQDCINTPGGFRCDCFEGFLLNEDNLTCYGEQSLSCTNLHDVRSFGHFHFL